MKNKVHIFTSAITLTLAALIFNPFALAAPSSLGNSGDNLVSIMPPGSAPREVYGPITLTDTLWSVATRFKPSRSVSVHQTTVAIYKLNPHAFKNGNINSIIAGGAIRIPTQEDVAKISHQEAVQFLANANKPKKRKNKKAISTRSDGKRIVKFSPEGLSPNNADAASDKLDNLEQLKQLNAELLQASNTIKEQNKTIAIYQHKLTTLEAEQQNVASSAAEIKAGEADALTKEQEKVMQLTEINHSLKMKSQSFDQELVALNKLLEEEQIKRTQLQEQLAKIKIKKSAEPKDIEPQKELGIYENLVLEPLNLLMVVIVYTLLLLVVIVLVMRLKERKEIAAQEKDLAESPMGVMDQDEGEFDSLLSDEFDDEAIAELDELTTDEKPFSEPVAEPIPDLTEELPELDDLNALDELPDLDEVLVTEDAITDLSEFDEAPVPEIDLNAPDDVELSDLDAFDEDAPDLVPAPSQGSEVAEEDIGLEFNLDIDESEEATEAELSVELDIADLNNEPAALDFPIKPDEVPATVALEDELELSLDLPETEPEIDLAIDEIEPELSIELEEPKTVIPDQSEVKDKEFVDIEKLMGGDESSEADPYEAPSLDVGLDDFPDMLPEHEDVDVDADLSGISTQLDLARAYLEIDDKTGAKTILEEVLAKGNESQIVEAKTLLEKIA